MENIQKENEPKNKTDDIGDETEDVVVSLIDQHVGARIKVRRCFLGLSQEYIADHLKVSFQQIQKYEKGFNRIGAGRLWRLATVLGVPVSYFYEDVDMALSTQIHPDDWAAMVPAFHDCDMDETQEMPRMNKMSLELLRAFSRIQDIAISKNILELVKSCADTYGTPEESLPLPDLPDLD